MRLAPEVDRRATSAQGGRDLHHVRFGAILAEVVRERGDRYPAVPAAVAQAAGGGEDEALGFGLDLVFDGLRARIDARTGPGPDPTPDPTQS